jgi:hypothetical protein
VPPETIQPIWSEEQLRYRVLRWVYERAGGTCTTCVTGEEIGSSLGLCYEDLFRVVYFLESRHFLFRMDAGFRLCVTPKGIRYIERVAGRRRSLRSTAVR